MTPRPHSWPLILRFFVVFPVLLLHLSCTKDDAPPPDSNPEGEIPLPFDPKDVMPVFSIHTAGATIEDEPKVDAEFTIRQSDRTLYEGRMGIEIRGASSQFFEKKSYGFETRDSSNEDLDVALMGFPEEEDWILHGPYSDKSLVRNLMIYDLAREMGWYSSRSELVELDINGDYKGIYVFMEKLKRDGDRIDIDKLDLGEISGEDLTGGYILKIDKLSGSNLGNTYNSENSFESQIPPSDATMGQTIKYLYEYPKAEDITSEQKQYISDYVLQFENALASDGFADPQTGYANFINVDSFIDFFILNELSNNVDGYRLSTYLNKDRSGKLNMGPIWDFNLAFGNADYCSGGASDVWAYKFNERCPEDFWQVPFWWERLLQDPVFTLRLKERWGTLRGSTLSNAAITDKIDGYIARMGQTGAIKKNFDTWQVLGVYVWPNKFVGAEYAEEADYLKNWTNDRLNWLDTAINAL